MTESKSGHRGVIFLVVLVVIGLLLAILDPADRARVMAVGAAMAEWTWSPVLIVLVQAALFATAMPGSLVVWLVAPFYEPVMATLILTAGSVLGGLGAYAVSIRAGESLRARYEGRPAFRILARHAGFSTQCALRVLPGFPHSVVNYGGGMLRVPLWSFMTATTIGAIVKWGVYTVAIHGVVDAEEAGDVLTPNVLLPLLLLALFLGVGHWASRRFQRKRDASAS